MTPRITWLRSTLALLGLMVLLGTAAAKNEEAIEARLRKDVTFLASNECEGRGVDTQGIQKAAAYIAKEFALAGLKPGGAEGTFFQPFTIFGQSKIDGPSTLKLKGLLGQEITLKLGVDFQVMGLSSGGKASAPFRSSHLREREATRSSIFSS